MSYIVYETTNTINGKIYIGVHNNTNPDYLGSGLHLLRAFKKYGRENFTRKILWKCVSAEVAFEIESKIVTENFVARTDNYNIKTGGLGGYRHSEATKSKISKKKTGKKASAETRAKMSEAHANITQETKDKLSSKAKGRVPWNKGGRMSTETKAKISAAQKDRKHSDETKAKMVASAKLRKTVTCPHCGKVGIKNNMTRWHFDNCRKDSDDS